MNSIQQNQQAQSQQPAESKEPEPPHGSFHGMDLVPIERPGTSNIRFVSQVLRQTLNSAEEGWGHSIVQVVGNPLQSLSRLHQWISNPLGQCGPAAVETSEMARETRSQEIQDLAMKSRVDALFNDYLVQDIIKSNATSCAENVINSARYDIPPSSELDVNDVNFKYQMKQITKQYFGETNTKNNHLGFSEIACRRVAQDAIKRTLLFAKKMSAAAYDHAAVKRFNDTIDSIAKDAVLKSLQTYTAKYKAEFSHRVASYVPINLQPVAEISFEPLDLIGKVTFINSDVEVIAFREAQIASSTAIAGFWEAAISPPRS